MREFYSVYRFLNDFILLAVFASRTEAEEYHAKQKRDGVPNLYSAVVTQSIGSLIVSLSPWAQHDGAELAVDIINKASV